MGVLTSIETLGLYEALGVADLTELRSLAADKTGRLKRVDGEFRLVKDPGFNLSFAIYTYYAALALSEALPGIVVPDDATGCWISDRPRIINSVIPTAAPQLRGAEWIAYLANPDRVVRFRADSLSSTPVVTDWKPVREIIAIEGAPSFLPDYYGEVVIDTLSANFYKATGTAAAAASWTNL